MRASLPRGFTLIELIIGIVVFSIIMTVIVGLIAPQSRYSVEPVWQVRASELAQSLMSEINARAFDDNLANSNSGKRCNESVACTTSGNLGPDPGESRTSYDDVDDFNGLNESGATILSAQGTPVLYNGQSLYSGFSVQVQVYYDDNEDGINDDAGNTGTVIGNVKRIVIVVTTPGGEAITFSQYRWNL
ncbi:type IV pilus modification PilV family protein [Alteromonas lipolytica]|uniref:Agglutinin biogenesis protein MshD n=1 Tax=Alteromonas lipolytica TaxID=1856405 RepID=A0A1E8F8I5_9ALTE|nr:prepilin-type N-terminal cleavage/methylation domain-containing protein [Alteromonas lipolytica]OFI32220.1 hypothetical protein BFC17_08355 [Alteromonas lipolytica]GGF82902.1 MSHA biogenesis protein MshD [Alteromonas lipolytica]